MEQGKVNSRNDVVSFPVFPTGTFSHRCEKSWGGEDWERGNEARNDVGESMRWGE